MERRRPRKPLKQQSVPDLDEPTALNLVAKMGWGQRAKRRSRVGESEEAVLLNIAPGRPVLRFERLSFDANSEPIKFVTSTCSSPGASIVA
jgi:hypothetical protein